MDSSNKGSDDKNKDFIFHIPTNDQTRKEKESKIDLSSLEQESDQSDLVIDQTFYQNLADKQAQPDAQAKNTNKKMCNTLFNDSLSRQKCATLHSMIVCQGNAFKFMADLRFLATAKKSAKNQFQGLQTINNQSPNMKLNFFIIKLGNFKML